MCINKTSSSFLFYHRSERRKFENLEFPTLSFCFIALGKIGDQAEPSARILDHGDRRSPSHKGFSGRPLWYQVKVLSQILLHFIFNVRQQINTLWFASYNLIRMKLVKKKNGVEVGLVYAKKVSNSTVNSGNKKRTERERNNGL